MKPIIQPGTGVGDLTFGMTRERVQQLLGEASSSETLHHEEDGDVTEVWHFDTRELSLGFDQTEDWRLVTISVTGGEYTLNDQALIGLSQGDLSKLLKELGEDDAEIEMLPQETFEGGTRVGSDLLSLNAWLEDGEVAEVTLMPGLTEDDEWIWPAHSAG